MSQYDEDADRWYDGIDDDNGKEERQITLYQVATTDKAILFDTLSNSFSDRAKSKQFWIPRSVITHISRERADLGHWPRCIVTCEEWVLNKNGV